MNGVFKMSEAVGTFSGPVAHSDTDQTHILVNMSCLNAWKKKNNNKKPKQNKLCLSVVI